MEETAQVEKEKVKAWFKDPLNLSLAGVLLFGLIIRIYYFSFTYTQPLWWDELAYGSLAKNFVSHMWDGTPLILRETLIRPPLFPLIWSFLLRFGLSEGTNKFVLEFLPSILTVFAVYLVGKEAYNKRVGVIASFIFSVLWIHLFYTSRLLTNIPALPLLFLSVYYFLRSTKNEFIPKYFAISLLLLSFSTLIRYPNGLIFFVFLISLASTRKLSLIKNKSFWKSAIIGVLPLLIFFVFNLINFGNIFPALLGGEYIEAGPEQVNPINFGLLSFIHVYLRTPFFIFFLVGFFLAVSQLVLTFDRLQKDRMSQANLIMVFSLLIIYAYFIFYLRVAEDRWLFATSLPLVILSGYGLSYAADLVKKNKKHLSVLLILLILAIGAKAQIDVVDPLIRDRMNTFSHMREGFKWIKTSTSEGSVILGEGIEPYAVYYADRRYEQLPKNPEDLENVSADYLVIHAFSPQPDYINSYIQENEADWQPVHAVFFDQELNNPAVIIYQRMK